MTWLHALVLGILQGVTEILPISSSAHLILVPSLLNWQESGLTFDVALHIGTLTALCIYFRRDIAELLLAFASGLASRDFSAPSARLGLYIIGATIPAAVIGKLFEDQVEAIFRSNPTLIALCLTGFGLLLAFADTVGPKRMRLDAMLLSSAMIIGCAQALALVPGVSRSGITITAALLLGFNREAAARFSFLLSLPVVAGAGILKGIHLAKTGIPAEEATLLLIGIASSAASGYGSIVLLLGIIRRHSLYPFVWYRLLAGSALLLWPLLK